MSFTLERVVFPILGVSYWQKAYNGADKLKDINTDYVEKSEGVIKIIMVTMIVLGVLLDILTCKYRRCARFIIYYEFIMTLLMSFVPINLGDLSNAFYVLNMCGNFCMFSCYIRREILACTIVLSI